MEGAKTGGLVFVLTLGLWFYAEREQTVTEQHQLIVEVDPRDPLNTIDVVRPERGLVTLELSGPKSKLEEALRQMDAAGYGRRVRVTPPADLDVGPADLPLLPLLRDRDVFQNAGITVLRVSPAVMEVFVDPQVERQVDVIAPPGLPALAAEPTFRPPVVKFVGPRAVLERLQEQGRLRAVAQVGKLTDFSDLSPGERVELQNVPIAPLENAQVRVEPDTVQASFQVAQTSEASTTLRALPFDVIKPQAWEGQFVIDLPATQSVLTNVTLVGPEEVIRQLELGTYEPYPRAMIISRDVDRPPPGQEANTVSRQPEYRLPPGVRVEDPDREVEFTVRRLPDGA
ncbi:MAG: hypothetical protein ACFCVE_07280 [Phycisphaerae bacterium]